AWGAARRTAEACPPMPRVASTWIAPGSCSAGARSRTEVSRRTGRCRCSAGRSLCDWSISPLPSVGAVVRSVMVRVLRPVRCRALCAVPSCQIPRRSRPATGEVASGRERREVSQDGESFGPCSEQAGDHLLGGLREALLLLLEVGLPRRERPDLEAVQSADDGAFPVQVRVGAQMARDGDAALLVRDDVLRAGEQHTQVVTGALVGGGRPTGLLETLGELHERLHGDAVLLSTSHGWSRGEFVAELRREHQSALLVDLGREGAEEHQRPPSPAATRDPDSISSQRAPLYPTSP